MDATLSKNSFIVSVRNARKSDVPVIVRFNAQLAAESENLQLDLDRLHMGVEAIVTDSNKGQYFVAIDDDNTVVGQTAVTYEWSDWRNAQIWWIQSVYVEPSMRGKGVFRRLYEHVRQAAISAGACSLRLYADDDNASAHSVYRKLGMSSHYKVFDDDLR